MISQAIDRLLGIESPRRAFRAVRDINDVIAAGERAAIQIARMVHDHAKSARRGVSEDWSQSVVQFHMTEYDIANLSSPGFEAGLRAAAENLAASIPPNAATTFSVHHYYDGECDWHEYTVWVHRTPHGGWMG